MQLIKQGEQSTPLVLPNVMEVVPSDCDGPVHLRGVTDARQDASANRHVSSERALLVDVLACTRCQQQFGISTKRKVMCMRT